MKEKTRKVARGDKDVCVACFRGIGIVINRFGTKYCFTLCDLWDILNNMCSDELNLNFRPQVIVAGFISLCFISDRISIKTL